MTSTSNQPSSLIEQLAKKRNAVSYGLIAAGIVAALLTIYWAFVFQNGRNDVVDKPAVDASQNQPVDESSKPNTFSDNGDYVPAAIWSGLLTAILLIAGAALQMRPTEAGREAFEFRVLLISVGALTGLVTALLGFALGWRWQESILQWVNENKIREARWVLAALAIFVGGLALMFVSMQPARTEERTSVLLRRLLYGTNSVLTGLLLLLVLVVVNVVVFLKLPDNVIMTAAAYKGLSESTKEYLRTIDEDVNVYLILPENYSIQDSRGESYNALYSDCRALLNACHSVNPRIKTLALLPATDDAKIKETMRRLKVPQADRDRYGLLVGYGYGEELSAFIPASELLVPTQQGTPGFQGENRLTTELMFLSGGAKRPVVYFTQSNLEPSIGEPAPGETSLRTAAEVVQNLRDRKYEVKPLRFIPGQKPDVSDATMIVIGAPRMAFSEDQVAFFREYMSGKKGQEGGKVIAMLPAFPDSSGQVSHTGLEALFIEHGIHVDPKRRLFAIPPRRELKPGWVLGGIAAASGELGHPLSRLLERGQFLRFGNVRPVSAVDSHPSEQSLSFNLFSTLVATYQDDKFDSNVEEINAQIAKEMEKNIRTTLQEKLVAVKPVPFGAYVAERLMEGKEMRERPKLLVLGTDWFIADDAIKQTPEAPIYVAITGALLEWMREKPRGMNVEPRALGTFSIPTSSESSGMRYLPFYLTFLGIIALGVGMWVARRT